MGDRQRVTEIFERSVEATDAYAKALLVQPGAVWGPRYVNAVARFAGLREDLHAKLGIEEEWRGEWGDPVDFAPIATNKLEQALRAGGRSGRLLGPEPWLLRSGDYLAEGGAATADGSLAVGVSGATGVTDEAIAAVLLATIRQQYRRWFAELHEQGRQRVP